MAKPVYRILHDADQAPIMTTIATTENYVTRSDLIKEHGISPTQCDLAIRSLLKRDWITQYVSRQNHSGRPPQIPVATDLFWQTYDTARNFAKSGIGKDRWLFSDAVRQFKQMREHRRNTRPYDLAYSNYLGRTALLTERYDLAQESSWFAGQAGWEALITINALCR